MDDYTARSRQLSASRATRRPPRPWIAAALSLLKPGLGHLYSWRLGLAAAAWAVTAALGVFARWLWVSTRVVAFQFTIFVVLILAYFAIAWHASRVAMTTTVESRPTRSRLVLVLVGAYAVATFDGLLAARWTKRNVVEAFRIASGSMEPNLLAGDWVFVSRKRVAPERDRLVVFTRHGQALINRVAGLPGDTLQMREGRLLRNGAPVSGFATLRDGPDLDANEFAWQTVYLTAAVDSRTYHPTTDNWGPLVIPGHQLFMLGDNRHSSLDSRFYGFISADSVVGHPTQVYYSRDSERGVTRWSRFGRRLDE